MAKPELDNLVKINQLKAEPPLRKEYDGMLKSAQRGLADAQNESIETDKVDVTNGEKSRKLLGQPTCFEMEVFILIHKGSTNCAACILR
jgi:hypothetical protein